jgi:DegV family protein with EDD domain
MISRIKITAQDQRMNNHKIAIVTDSTSDLPPELIKKYDIYTVPVYVVWDEEPERDGVDISHEAFYERLVSDSVYPTTSQPSPQDFFEVYQQAKSDGADEIFAIVLSGGLSGTIKSAQLAASQMDIPVEVYDSRTTSMSLGWQVLAAATARAAGADVQGILAAADGVRKKLTFIVTLNTLDYLHQGGRIGGAAHFIGTVLNLKPQVVVNHETGLVEAGERVRTRRKSIEVLYRNFFERVNPSQGALHIAVLYTTAKHEALQMAERIRREFNPVELIVAVASPVLGVHTGPESIALAGYSEG